MASLMHVAPFFRFLPQSKSYSQTVLLIIWCKKLSTGILFTDTFTDNLVYYSGLGRK